MAKRTKATKISCGFDKWVIGIGKDFDVFVDFNRNPIMGKISLRDASKEELEAIGNMFLKVARSVNDV